MKIEEGQIVRLKKSIQDDERLCKEGSVGTVIGQDGPFLKVNMHEHQVTLALKPDDLECVVSTQIKYNRILLKLSGQSFCKPGEFGIDGSALESIAKRIAEICKLGPQVAVVVGAGNFLRGESFSKTSHIPRNTADYMGMLATIINACALQETLEKLGQPTRVLSAIEVPAMCERFIRRRAIRHLERGRVAILAGGTGNPFFTTDTCAALRASELDADLLIKATKVQGVYSDDPEKNPDAQLFEELPYDQVLAKNLRIMDHSAISLCRDNNIPIIVLNIFEKGNITKAICGRQVGTKIVMK